MRKSHYAVSECILNGTWTNITIETDCKSMFVKKCWSYSCWQWASIGLGDAWWRHQMETFSALLAICVGNSPVPGEFPAQRPVTRSSDVFLDLRLNKRLSKQSWGWWFDTLSRPLGRHCNGLVINLIACLYTNKISICINLPYWLFSLHYSYMLHYCNC